MFHFHAVCLRDACVCACACDEKFFKENILSYKKIVCVSDIKESNNYQIIQVLMVNFFISSFFLG